MSKLQKVVLIVFCIGVLLCGLGSGIALTEFSTLSYGGKQVLGEPDMRTENFDVEFEPGEETREIVGGWRNGCSVVTDESVPENTVRFCVTYNADVITPYAYWDKESEQIYCSYFWHDMYDEMAYMMEAKDAVLQNLKEGKLVSFYVPDFEEMTILVNPDSMSDVWVPGR